VTADVVWEVPDLADLYPTADVAWRVTFDTRTVVAFAVNAPDEDTATAQARAALLEWAAANTVRDGGDVDVTPRVSQLATPVAVHRWE
jgi:hypothetical protein